MRPREAGARLNLALEGRYEVLEEIGQGGMALVFLAEDLRHRRKVALKVLRPELAAALGSDRFLAEIEVTANLQHPNILPLFDSGEADGSLFFVMPYIEGESLRERMDREGQLPVEEAVRIARSVAAALDYAHRRDVIHRDIKPSNILLHEGQALVTDFGIALAMRKAGGDARLTDTGLSVGTPHYMSPEQAAGDRELDARSDVYALGATLYEMLVGEPPHGGRTPQAVVARILSETPAPVRRTRELVPPNVEAAVAKALARTPADRFRTAAEFAAALSDPSFTVPGFAGATSEARNFKRSGVWPRVGPVLVVLLLATALFAAWGWLRPEEPRGVARYPLAFPPGQELVDQELKSFDVSDGAEVIVYVGPGPEGTQLWVKEREELEARPLPGTDGAVFPRLSPDGREVLYWLGVELWRVPAVGGAPVLLADGVAPVGAEWLEDGTLVSTSFPGGRLCRVSPSGRSSPEEFGPEFPSTGQWAAGSATRLPDSRGLVFSAGNAVERIWETWVFDFRSDTAKRILTGGFGVYLDPGYLQFLRPDGALFAYRFDLDALEPVGEPIPLLEGVKMDGVFPDLAVARDWTLLMLRASGSRGIPDREMVWISRGGAIQAVDAAWTLPSARRQGWELSPDGTRLAVGIGTREGDDIWIRDLENGSFLPLADDPQDESEPAWSPTGDLVYFAWGDNFPDLYARRADRVEGSFEVNRSAAFRQADLSPGGGWLVAGTSILNVLAFRLVGDTSAAGPGVPLLTEDYAETSPQISPDGSWLAYASMESGEWEIWVRPFPEVDAPRWIVSRGGGHGPRWSHDGDEIFYVSGNREMMAATVETEDGFRVTGREALFSIPADVVVSTDFIPFDVSLDDQRFLMMRTVGEEAESAPPTLVLVENWWEEVDAKLQGGR